MADRLSGKWMIRGLLAQEEDWAVLIFRNLHKVKLAGHHKWSNLPYVTSLFSSLPIKPVGSPLVQSLWKAWNRIKIRLSPAKSISKAAGLWNRDSIWWPWVEIPLVDDSCKSKALKLHRKGIRTWGNLWNEEQNRWLSGEELKKKFSLNPSDLALLMDRMSIWSDQWKVGIKDQLRPSAIRTWHNSPKLLPIPGLDKKPPIHAVLNQKWGCLWDRKQWEFKFAAIWNPWIQPKKASLMWLIFHKGIWSMEKASKRGIGNELP